MAHALAAANRQKEICIQKIMLEQKTEIGKQTVVAATMHAISTTIRMGTTIKESVACQIFLHDQSAKELSP